MDAVAKDLLDGIDQAIPRWVSRSVARLVEGWTGAPATDAVQVQAEAAGEEASAAMMPRLRELLDADVDEQATTPLAILRDAVSYPAAVLRAVGVPPVERDAFAEQRFPDDVYDLTPATFADLDPALTEVGLAWGAAKAWEHKRRHQP
jgi:hypothetical protein